MIMRTTVGMNKIRMTTVGMNDAKSPSIATPLLVRQSQDVTSSEATPSLSASCVSSSFLAPNVNLDNVSQALSLSRLHHELNCALRSRLTSIKNGSKHTCLSGLGATKA